VYQPQHELPPSPARQHRIEPMPEIFDCPGQVRAPLLKLGLGFGCSHKSDAPPAAADKNPQQAGKDATTARARKSWVVLWSG